MSEKLLTCRSKRPDAKVRLFGFPWAGAGASVFAPWNKMLSPQVELVGVTLPGRESRYKEPCSFSSAELASQVATAIKEKYSDKPFFFLGHSMGALLSQEVAGLLRDEYGLEVARMYVSGEMPPTSKKERVAKNKTTDFKSMDEETLRKTVVAMRVLPENLTSNEEMLKIYLPIMRADLAVDCDITYNIPCRLAKKPLTCPLVFLEAVEETIDYDVDAWKQLTTGEVVVKQYPGAHYYLKDPDNVARICDLINNHVAEFNP